MFQCARSIYMNGTHMACACTDIELAVADASRAFSQNARRTRSTHPITRSVMVALKEIPGCWKQTVYLYFTHVFYSICSHSFVLMNHWSPCATGRPIGFADNRSCTTTANSFVTNVAPIAWPHNAGMEYSRSPTRRTPDSHMEYVNCLRMKLFFWLLFLFPILVYSVLVQGAEPIRCQQPSARHAE